MFLQILQKNADYYPNETAIVYEEERVSHKELLEKVESCAHGLIALGLQAGQRVGILQRNSPNYIISFFAIAACRAIVVPLRLEYQVGELTYYLQEIEASFCITDQSQAKKLSEALENVDYQIQTIETGDSESGNVKFTELLKNNLNTELPNGSLDDTLMYLYSSGTTGQPKCSTRTVIQLWRQMDMVIQTLNVTKQDSILCLLPLQHSYVTMHCMCVAVGSGAKLVFFKGISLLALQRNKALKLIETEKITILPSVPHIPTTLLGATVDVDLSSIRLCYSGCSLLPKKIVDNFFEKFNIRIAQNYGSSEIGPLTINLDDSSSYNSNALGTSFLGIRILIVDDNGNELAQGEQGEIIAYSRAMAKEYLNSSNEDDKAFSGGYFHTGDLGYLDEKNQLFLVGRKKLVIEISGHKFNPIEVESVLIRHAKVDDCVVIGAPGCKNVETVVKAYVTLSQPCTEKELKSFCAKQMAIFKTPQQIVVISKIPQTTIGKIIRQQEVLDSYSVPMVREK